MSDDVYRRIDESVDRILAALREEAARPIEILIDGRALGRVSMSKPLAREPLPRGADIEIVERSPGDGGTIIPNRVRINGVEVLVPDDHPITVHEITPSTTVLVTLTVFASSLTVTHEQG